MVLSYLRAVSLKPHTAAHRGGQTGALVWEDWNKGAWNKVMDKVLIQVLLPLLGDLGKLTSFSEPQSSQVSGGNNTTPSPASYQKNDTRCKDLGTQRGLMLGLHYLCVLGRGALRWPEMSLTLPTKLYHPQEE